MSPNQVQVELNDGGETTFQTKNIIIATGHSPTSIPGIEIDGSKVVNYEHAILADTLPSSVVVIGAGAIGVEFSYIWNSYGVPVTVVEMLGQVMPNTDREISQELDKQLSKRGVNIKTGAKVTKVEKLTSGVNVTVETEGGDEILTADQVLLAASFVPNR